MHDQPVLELLLRSIEASSQVSKYCDRIEHNEQIEREWILAAGEEFRQIAYELSVLEGENLVDLYANRLQIIEERNVLFDGESLQQEAREVQTWRQLQLVQAKHDRIFHPDVIGLTRIDQLRHYAFHVTKLVGAIAARYQNGSSKEFHLRLADVLLFGIKLSTVMNEALPKKPIL
jgi:hypothetical protein